MRSSTVLTAYVLVFPLAKKMRGKGRCVDERSVRDRECVAALRSQQFDFVLTILFRSFSLFVFTLPFGCTHRLEEGGATK